MNEIILDQLRKIIVDSGILKEDDKKWPEPDRVGRQELEIVIDGRHKPFQTSKFGSFNELQQSSDPEGLTIFWYLIQDIKCFVLSLINAHFRVSFPLS